MKQKQHFMINDINYIIGFGKHSGKSIKRIYQGEPVIRQSIKSKLYTVLNSWIKDRKLFDHIVENDLSEAPGIMSYQLCILLGVSLIFF